MTDREKLIIRLEEQINIYKDSPNVAATYVDLVRVNEVLLQILRAKEINGFKETG